MKYKIILSITKLTIAHHFKKFNYDATISEIHYIKKSLVQTEKLI